jgi:hypothetical protein
MLWICNGCETAYSVDAPCCPHCGSKEYRLSTDPEPELLDATPLGSAEAVNVKGGKPDA